MAINYASKYSSKVDEKFTLESKTNVAVNQDYDWTGVSTVVVYNIPTSALGDYTATGSNRYGEPSELQDEKQEFTLSQDKAFTFTIDRKNYDDTMMTKEAGRCLAREVREQVIPMVDKYRINKMVAGGTKGVAVAPTKANAYEIFLKGTETLGENSVPETGRIAYVSFPYYNLLKQDPAFVKASDMGQKIAISGVVGYVDGVAIIPLPTSYFPVNVYLAMTHKVATTSPMKLVDYKIHQDPPGISGWLVEGRVRYDAFVLKNKAKAIYSIASK